MMLEVPDWSLEMCSSLMVFDTPMIKILDLYLDFEDAKNIHVLSVLIWGFGGCSRFLTGVWNLDLALDKVNCP